MKRTPLVTVITVFLNAERFLEEAIASVFAQSYGEWELLLVDDGSTDGSTAMALRYAQQHPYKVRYLQHAGHENRGISASQNLGIRNARGEFIAFLDSDDAWLAEKLERQISILESQPEAMMLYGQTDYWYSWTGEVKDAKRDLIIEPGVRPNTLVRPPSLLVSFLREEIPIPCPSDIMVRRQGVIETGGFEESFRRIFTDQVFYAKLTLTWPVSVSGQRWSKYRKHPGSAVAVVKKSGQMRSARLEYLKRLEGYLDSREIDDVNLRRAVASARRKCLLHGLPRLGRHISYRRLLIKNGLRVLARRTISGALCRLLRTRQDNDYLR